MDKEVLEVVLKNLAKESRVATILDVEVVSALPKGENYSSIISRVIVKVVLGNGRKAKKTFIMKQMLTEGKSGEYSKQLNAAGIESHVLSVIHKQMSYLMEEFEDSDEPLWCNFVHYDPQLSCILLEDLKATGYSCVPRQGSLDLDHAILALRALGKYHGLAKILEQRGIISKDDYKPYPLFEDLTLIRCVSYGGVIHVSKVIAASWGPSWKEAAEKLMIPFEPFVEKFKTIGKIRTEESEFTVLNHGDCWSNNMMFKYDFQKRPIAVKLLDFQIPHHNSPCMDVTYLIYLGVRPAVRRSNYQLLLKTYYDSLVRTLDQFGFAGSKPTFEAISATMKRFEFLGLVFFAVLYPIMACSSTEAMDVEKLITTDGKEGFNEDVLREPEMVEKLGPDIIELVEKYVPDLK
ncbi:uncharacterized protein [Halyomorpha halys]|uniref:uncharacterized protein n=1 Tax=Halyomorpha halys TaxID=286706 RepID=UPI0006D527EC|nr:uncharacterized protein LOC106679592 [Halyomorpha halys]